MVNTQNFKVIIVDGSEYVSSIARQYNVTVDLLLECNTQLISYSALQGKIANYPSTKEYLKDCLKKNLPLVGGLEIRIPTLNTGRLTDNSRDYYNYIDEEVIASRSSNAWQPQPVDYNDIAISEGAAFISGYSSAREKGLIDRSKPSLQQDYDEMRKKFHTKAGVLYTSFVENGYNILKNPEDFNCMYTILAGGAPVVSRWLPCIPSEVSDEVSASFNAVEIFGRSVSYQVYNTSSRSVSFSLTLYADLVQNQDSMYIYDLVAELQSACYPQYNNNETVAAPEIIFYLGDQLNIRGILNSANCTWKLPMITVNGQKLMSNCDLNINITETTGPYSMADIQSSRGKRGATKNGSWIKGAIKK